MIDVDGHLFTFFLNGHDTSSHFLSNGIDLLAQNPDVQKKLHEEIFAHKFLDYDRLNQLLYLDKVFTGNFLKYQLPTTTYLFIYSLSSHFKIEIFHSTPFPFPLRKKCTDQMK